MDSFVARQIVEVDPEAPKLSSCLAAVEDTDLEPRKLTQACHRLRTEAVHGEGRLVARWVVRSPAGPHQYRSSRLDR